MGPIYPEGGRQRRSLENSLLLCCFGAVSFSIHFWRKTCWEKQRTWNSGPALENVDIHLVYGPFQVALVVKDLTVGAGEARDSGSVPGAGRSPERGNDNPCQYSCLGNSMDKKPGRLKPIELQRVRHHWVLEHAHKHTHLISTKTWRLQVFCSFFFFLLSRVKEKTVATYQGLWTLREALTMRFTYWMLWFPVGFTLVMNLSSSTLEFPRPLVCLLGMQPCVPLTLLHKNPSQTTTVIEPALRTAMESLNSGLVLHIFAFVVKIFKFFMNTLLSADSGPLSERSLPPLWPLPPSSSSQSCSSWLRTWALDLFCPLTRTASFPWYEYMNVLIPFQKDFNLTLLFNSALLSPRPPPILFSSRGQLSCLPHNLIFCCCCLFPVLPVLVGFFFFSDCTTKLVDFSSLMKDWPWGPWDCGVLTTGLPGNLLWVYFFKKSFLQFGFLKKNCIYLFKIYLFGCSGS